MRAIVSVTLAAVSVWIATAAPTWAISRYNSNGMSCAAVQNTIRREGAVIFRYPGRSGAILYDRYVADERFCAGGEYAKSGTLPTRDSRNCPVRHCEIRPSPGDCDSILDEGCFGWR